MTKLLGVSLGIAAFATVVFLGFVQPAAAARCGSWSGWSETSRECKFGAFCFGARQRKTVIHYQRSRQCKNGIQQQNKQKSMCGC